MEEFNARGKAELEKTVKELTQKLKDQIRLKKETEIEKEEEKIQATDKLKKYMLEKIQVTKTGIFWLLI